MDEKGGTNFRAKPLREWVHKIFAPGETPRRVAFRVDGGNCAGLSYGHVFRCMAFARTLEERFGAQSLFLMHKGHEGAACVRRAGFPVALVDDAGLDGALDQARQIARERGIGWLVVDLPYAALDARGLEDLEEQGLRCVFIDDARFIAPAVAAVLNSSILAPDRVRTQSRVNTRFFLGPDFFLYESLPVAAPRSKEVRTVALTFGGADPSGLTVKALRALERETAGDLRFTFMLGPGYARPEAVLARTRQCPERFAAVVAPENLLELLARFDLTVCAGGRTMYELHCMGAAFFPVASIGHEAEAVREFVRRGLAPAGLEQWDDRAFLAILKRLAGLDAA